MKGVYLLFNGEWRMVTVLINIGGLFGNKPHFILKETTANNYSRILSNTLQRLPSGSSSVVQLCSPESFPRRQISSLSVVTVKNLDCRELIDKGKSMLSFKSQCRYRCGDRYEANR